jgi:hypothetical protein
MFTEPVSSAAAESFSRLLGAPLISCDHLEPSTDRAAYFVPARSCRNHLFLDPDTGLRVAAIRGAKAPAYLFLSELQLIAAARASALTLVFDQSVARGRERPQLERKLRLLGDHGLKGLAYVSHACFLLVGCDGRLLERAYDAVRANSGLPEERFLRVGAA